MTPQSARVALRTTSDSFKSRRLNWVTIIIAVAWSFALNATLAQGQTYQQSVGVPTFTTAVHLEENGFINTANGNLHLEIPLGSYPQRAGGQAQVSLVYDSSIWTPASMTWQPNNVAVSNGTANSWGGWRLVTSADQGAVYYSSFIDCYVSFPSQYQTLYQNFIWVAPDGTAHSFPIATIAGASGGSCPTPFPFNSALATDASGYRMTVSNGNVAEVTAPDGTVVYNANLGTHAPEDTNGNFYSYSNGQPHDTLGRNLVATTLGNPMTYSIPNSQGGTGTYTVTTETVDVDTDFGVSGVTEYSGTITAIQSIQLPDGTNYSFTYDSGTTPGHYGLLQQMSLPKGGAVSYSFTNFTDAYGNTNQWISGRTADGVWSYTPAVISNCASNQVNCEQKFTVLKPSGDSSVYTYVLNGGAWPIQVQYYTGLVSSGTLLATTNLCYSFVTLASGQCSYSVSTGSPTSYIQKTAETTVLPVPGGANLNQTVEYTSDSYSGVLQQLSQWNDYSGSVPTTADRTTSITYLGGASYLGANILNRPATVTVTDKNGGTVAKTVYCYDYAGGCGGSSLTSVTGVVMHDDNIYGSSNTTRGNLTQIQRLISGSSYLTTSATFDTTGQLLSSTDPNGNQTTLSYTDAFFTDNGNGSNPASFNPGVVTNAYATHIAPPLIPASTLGYYYGTGQLASATDANSETAYSHFYDPLNRPTATALPNYGWTLTQYHSTGVGGSYVLSGVGINSSSPSTSCSTAYYAYCRLDLVYLDGMERVYTANTSDPDAGITVDTPFDSNGRVKTVSNPYRSTSDTTYGVETPSYDGLDRVIQIKHPDNNIAYTYYGAAVNGNGQSAQQCSSSVYGLGYPILTVDESGNKSQTWVDAFGRVIEADEPNTSGSLSANTCYTYDLNNNLTGVTAVGGTQTRSYSYDILSRLTSKTEPETGTTTYIYDQDTNCPSPSTFLGLRISRTDGRGIRTCMQYDALNRVTQKNYSDTTPSVTYYYDQTSYNGLTITNGKGRRTGMSDGSGQTAWSYDSLGNVLTEQRTIAGVTKTISYSYALDGSVKQVVYPSNRAVSYVIGGAERPTEALDIANNIVYANRIPNLAMYAPNGAPSNIAYSQLNSYTYIDEERFYNTRFQSTSIVAIPLNSNPTALSLGFSYATGNNGNLASQTNGLDNGRTQNYTYDNLNRLLTAQSHATSGVDCWGQSFGNGTTAADDPLANLLAAAPTQSGSGCTGPNLAVGVNSSNQIITPSGFSYDSAGNTTGDGNYSYTFDAENRLITASGMSGGPYCYFYDGDGLRVEKANANGGSCTNSPTVDVLYWRNLAGDTIAETDSTGSTSNANYHEYIFFAGRRVARSDPSSGNVYYYFADHLGSTRALTQADGTLCFSADYYPYGQELDFTTTCNTTYKFNGYERDAETGLDYAFARYYNARLGRFMSGDPGPGGIDAPQSLNGYSFARNNPANVIDPDGADPYALTLGFNPGDGGGGGGGGWGGLGFNGGGGGGFGDCGCIVPPGSLAPGWQIPTAWTPPAAPWWATYGKPWISSFWGPTQPFVPSTPPAPPAPPPGPDRPSQQAATPRAQGFFGNIADKFLDFLAAHADYLPGACTGGVFGFGGVGPGTDKGGGEGGVLVDKQIGRRVTVQPIGEAFYGPVGVGATPSETLVFVEPSAKIPAGAVFAANPQNGFINNSGISIGVFAGKPGHRNLGPIPATGGYGGGIYLTFSSAANCLKNF